MTFLCQAVISVTFESLSKIVHKLIGLEAIWRMEGFHVDFYDMYNK